VNHGINIGIERGINALVFGSTPPGHGGKKLFHVFDTLVDVHDMPSLAENQKNFMGTVEEKSC
jgi:hypothetical protein